MTPFERHLQAAAGFLALGMLADAEAELEQIEPEMRTLSEVLAVRVLIYQALGNWEPMRSSTPPRSSCGRNGRRGSC